MATVTVSFTLDDSEDRRILQWLARQSKRQKSAAIRVALNDYLDGQGVTLTDIYQALQEIDCKLGKRTLVVNLPGADDTGEADEPQDIATALDSLGL